MAATDTEKQHGVQRCAVCKIDRKGRFILADPMAQDLFGLGEVELFGRPLIDFVEPDDHQVIETMTTNRNPYETVFDAAPVKLLDHQQNSFTATLIISVNFGGGNPANYQVIIFSDTPPAEEKAPVSSQGWLDYIEYLSENDQVESPESLAQLLVALEPVASATIYETDAHKDNQLARAGSRSSELIDEDEMSSDYEVRASFGLANGRTGLAVLTLPASNFDLSEVRGRAELAAVLLHSLCPIGTDVTAETAFTPGLSVSQLLNQLQIGTLEIDNDGQVQLQNEVFNELFQDPPNIECLADLMDHLESLGDRTAAASIAAYFNASAGCDTPPSLRLSLGLNHIGTVILSYERTHPGTEDLSGAFLFSRVDVLSAVGSEANQAPIDLTLAGLDHLRSSMAAARSIWLKLEHGYQNELSGEGGFYLRSLSHHIDTVEHSLIDLEQLLKLTSTAEEAHVVNLGLVIDKIVAELETGHTGLSLNVGHVDLPSPKTHLQKLTAALRQTIDAMIVRAETAKVDIRISSEMNNGTCTLTIHGDGPRMTKKQVRRAFEYVGPKVASRDRALSNRTAGLAQARVLIQSMGGRLILDPNCPTGVTVKIAFPEV